MSRLDDILTSLDAYKLNQNLTTGGTRFSIDEHYAMFPELSEARDEIEHMLIESYKKGYTTGAIDAYNKHHNILMDMDGVDDRRDDSAKHEGK